MEGLTVFYIYEPNNSFNRSGISLHVIRKIEGFSQCFPPG
jgi:hypothetical protein